MAPCRIALALLALLLALPAMAQERRVALVVGANAYRSVAPLSNAVADARAVAVRLSALGFEVVGPVIDPGRAEFEAALDRFEGRLQGASLGLFFYAGHAVEVGGRNLLLPVDAPAATSERQLRSSSIDAQEVLAGVLARAPRAVMILDACRDNPLPRDAARGNRPVVGGTRGLEPIEAPRRDDGGGYVVLAAAPGDVALDRLPGDDRDPNGLFTRHLLRALANPARPLPMLMGEVRDAVAASARGANRRQVPEITDRMVGSGQVMLAGLAAGAVVPAPPSPAPVPASPTAPSEALELALWQSVQSSRNVADFEEYLRRFPTGVFAGIARNRIGELRASDPSSAAPPAPQPTTLTVPHSMPPEQQRVVAPQVDPAVINAPPNYPEASRQSGEAGSVGLTLAISPTGRVTNVAVTQTSGFPRLDDAARLAAMQWRFLPGTRDGHPVASSVRTSVNFRLQDPVR